MAFPVAHIKGSDTVTVTPDGRTIVDVEKLMQKEHIRAMLSEIRRKTSYRKATKAASEKLARSV